MELPSRLFLTRLANDQIAPGTLRLDAARRLPGAEQRISEDRAARARRRSEPDEQARRREIDRFLAEAERELETAKQETLNVQPVADQVRMLEPQPTPPAAPPDEISCEAQEQPAHAAVRIPDSPDDSESKREELLAQGRALAAAILTHLEIMSHAPLNWHAGQKKLQQLQGDFLAWERAMRVDYPDMDTQRQFPDARLRPAPKIIDARTYQAHRRVLTLDEALAVPLAEAKPTHDDGFWTGMPAGI